MPYTLREVSKDWFHLMIGGQSYSIYLPPLKAADGIEASVNGKSASIRVLTERDLLLDRFGFAHSNEAADKVIRAPMPGLVLETLVETGTAVRKGDGLLVLEAMKMENEIRASTDATVKRVLVAAGDAVSKNEILVELE